jgi:hypothetical protein
MEGEGSKHQIFQKQLIHSICKSEGSMFKMFGNLKQEVDNDE